MKKICIIKVGNIVAGLLDVIFLGRAKDIAGFIAWSLFKTHNCKCEERRIFLNEFFGCKEGIKLN